ncbi:hypothetical protein pb186bvf_020021 [Paramecium bursaria]
MKLRLDNHQMLYKIYHQTQIMSIQLTLLYIPKKLKKVKRLSLQNELKNTLAGLNININPTVVEYLISLVAYRVILNAKIVENKFIIFQTTKQSMRKLQNITIPGQNA